MSRNPNMQKMGKRKIATGQKQPDWLFPHATDPALLNPQTDTQSKNKQEKKLARQLLEHSTTGEPFKLNPPVELVAIVEAFLIENGFTKTSQSFTTERKQKGTKSEPVAGSASLNTIYNEWRGLKEDVKGKNDVAVKQQSAPTKSAKDVTSSNSDSDSDGSASSSGSEDSGNSDVEMKEAAQVKKTSTRKTSPSSSSSSASSSSDSDADDESDEGSPAVVKPVATKVKVNILKRKASPSSNCSSSSDSDSSSEDEAPKVKKLKTEAASSSSDSSSESDSASSSSAEDSIAEATKEISISSESGSSSDEDSDSSTTSTNLAAQRVPLPDYSSESSSSSSDSDSETENTPKKLFKKAVSSDTSATLSDGPKKTTDSSSDSASEDSNSQSNSGPNTTKITATVTKTTIRKLSPPLPPTPVIKLSKKTNVPFSRIPKDTQVNERLASNAYVPYDYAQKAHEDLIVTKGKGFTKEKNKKKRGSYRGGYIDVEGKKGIKFED